MNKNKVKGFSTFINRLSSQRLVSFSRLTVDNIPHVSKFLNYIWSQYYGKTGSPVFDEDYLSWVLGGPSKDKNLLYGAFVNDELVAYQSLLFRKISCCKKELNAYLHTHRAVSPKLDMRLRMDCGFQMTLQTMPIHPDSCYYDPNCDLVFGYLEETKLLKNVGDNILQKYFDIDRRTCGPFNQCVIMHGRLTKFLNEHADRKKLFNIRLATEQDFTQLTSLFNQLPERPHFIMLMTEAELRHYCFGHSTHRTYVVEKDGKIDAFINFYPLEMIKEGKIFLYIIIDFLIADRVHENNNIYFAALLHEAVKHAEEIKARSVVFENATYLNYESFRTLGLIPSFRKMNMVLAAKDNSITYEGNFRCDVK